MSRNPNIPEEPLSLPANFLNLEIRDFSYNISARNIANFNQVVSSHNDNAIHPLYFSKISWQILKNLGEHIAGDFDRDILNTMVHQSEYLIFHKPLSFPDEVKVRSQFWSISPHNRGTELTIRFDYYSNNELMVSEFSSGILFGVTCKERIHKKGELPAIQAVDPPPIWRKFTKVDRHLPFQYAEKAEIDAPIHTNEKFAKSLGLPDIIVQGTCTFAKAVSLILESNPPKPGISIASVAAKFTGMLVPPDRISVCLLLKNRAGLYFEVKNGQGQPLIKGGQILFNSPDNTRN